MASSIARGSPGVSAGDPLTVVLSLISQASLKRVKVSQQGSLVVLVHLSQDSECYDRPGAIHPGYEQIGEAHKRP